MRSTKGSSMVIYAIMAVLAVVALYSGAAATYEALTGKPPFPFGR